MSLIKKSDVKNHLSRLNRTGIHLLRPASQPDATGFSGVEPGSAYPNTDHSVEQPLKQPTSSGPEATPVVIASASSRIVAPAVSKSAQA